MTIPRHQKAIAVRAVGLSQPLRTLTDVIDYSSVCVFVMWNGNPLGRVDIVNQRQPISVARLSEAIVDQLAVQLLKGILTQHSMVTDGEAAAMPASLSPDVPVSIVVATLDRPGGLRNCLRCLVAQESPRPVEIIVVDNNPASGVTPPVVAEFPGVALVSERRKGLAYARNKGIITSRGDIVIATDDDVTIPRDWLEKLLAPFVRSDVMVVTGNVLPLELETTAQHLFEVYGGLGRGFEPLEVDGDWFRSIRLSGVPTWKLGATANAAFRASIFSDPQIGLMDETLGPGMPSGVGEDTYLFYKVLKAGYTITYEPAAYVWHKHRRDLPAFRRQIYDYSKGHVAYHLRTLLRDHDLRALVHVAVRLPGWHVWRIICQIKDRLRGQRSDYSLSLILLEMAGNLAGPWSLWQSCRRVKREGRSQPYIPVSQRTDTVKEPPLIEAHDYASADVL